MEEHSAWIRRLEVQVHLGSRFPHWKLLKTFSRTYVPESKINAVAGAQSTFQRLTLHTNISTLAFKLIPVSGRGPSVHLPDAILQVILCMVPFYTGGVMSICCRFITMIYMFNNVMGKHRDAVSNGGRCNVLNTREKHRSCSSSSITSMSIAYSFSNFAQGMAILLPSSFGNCKTITAKPAGAAPTTSSFST